MIDVLLKVTISAWVKFPLWIASNVKTGEVGVNNNAFLDNIGYAWAHWMKINEIDNKNVAKNFMILKSQSFD